MGVIPEDWDRPRLEIVARVQGSARDCHLDGTFRRSDAHSYVRVSDMIPEDVRPSAIKYVPTAFTTSGAIASPAATYSLVYAGTWDRGVVPDGTQWRELLQRMPTVMTDLDVSDD